MPNAQRRTVKRLTQGAIASALKASGGMVTLAAQSLGCSHTSIYRRLKTDAVLQQIVDGERSKHIDIAETALKRACMNGEAWAVCFTLKTIGRLRGYVERVEHFNIDVTRATDEQLDRIAAGEDPAVVMATSGDGGAGTQTPLASDQVQ